MKYSYSQKAIAPSKIVCSNCSQELPNLILLSQYLKSPLSTFKAQSEKLEDTTRVIERRSRVNTMFKRQQTKYYTET